MGAAEMEADHPAATSADSARSGGDYRHLHNTPRQDASVAAKMSVVRRERLREEVRILLSTGALDGARVRKLALSHGCSERAVWRARRWVLDHLRIVDPVDRGRERRATLLMLDSVTTSAAAAGKYREAIAGLKLRVDLLGLDSFDGEERPAGVGARSVEELLEVIAEAEGLRDRLAAPIVHEDEE